jgi:hypothetical protein
MIGSFAFALLAMLLWACVVIALSRWTYGLAFLGGLGCYVGAFLLGRELGFASVAQAWVSMAAIGAVISTVSERKGSDGRPVPFVPSLIATFIVGLLAWPLVFPGIRTPKTEAPAAQPPAAASADADEVDASEAIAPVPEGKPLADRPGIATTSVVFADQLRIVFGSRDLHAEGVRSCTLGRATATALAYMHAADGTELTWDERAGEQFRLSDYDECGGQFALLDRDGAVLQHIARTRFPTMFRDEWYALAAAFGRLYVGAVVVEDSLAGLDA